MYSSISAGLMESATLTLNALTIRGMRRSSFFQSRLCCFDHSSPAAAISANVVDLVRMLVGRLIPARMSALRVWYRSHLTSGQPSHDAAFPRIGSRPTILHAGFGWAFFCQLRLCEEDQRTTSSQWQVRARGAKTLGTHQPGNPGGGGRVAASVAITTGSRAGRTAARSGDLAGHRAEPGASLAGTEAAGSATQKMYGPPPDCKSK